MITISYFYDLAEPIVILISLIGTFLFFHRTEKTQVDKAGLFVLAVHIFFTYYKSVFLKVIILQINILR